MTAPSPEDITTLLRAWGGGDESALARLTPLVYKRLRQIAHAQLRGERRGHILQPTALINEVYVRLLKSAPIDFRDRAHFYALAARAMRRILIDLAKTHQAWIALDGHHRTSEERLGPVQHRADPLFVQIHEALLKMEGEYPRQAAVLELNYYGGLKQAEIAEVVGYCVETVARDLKFAVAWMQNELGAQVAAGLTAPARRKAHAQ